MDDLISRQAAITLPVIPKEYREYQTSNLDDAYEQGWNDLQKCIESLPSAQQWIPCSERLPEEFKRVLCCTDMREMFLARVYIFDDGNYSFDDEDGMAWEGNVVAWMPLPDPYEVKSNG